MKLLLAFAVAVSLLDLSEASPLVIFKILLQDFLSRDFARSDIDKNNVLTKNEYFAGFHIGDVNSDGEATLEEFTAARGFPKEVAANGFQVLDIDGNGFVTEPEIGQVFVNQDANGDGSVSHDEFLKYYLDLYLPQV